MVSATTESGGCCGPIRMRMIMACSGASNLGAIADQAARRVARTKQAAMGCAVAIGAQIPELVAKARWAPRIVALDGCENACARKCLERAELRQGIFLELEKDFGMIKGETPVSEEAIERVAQRAAELLTEKVEP